MRVCVCSSTSVFVGDWNDKEEEKVVEAKDCRCLAPPKKKPKVEGDAKVKAKE